MAKEEGKFTETRLRKSLAAQLQRQISKRISRGDFKPGDELPSEQEFQRSRCERLRTTRSMESGATSLVRASLLTQPSRSAFF